MHTLLDYLNEAGSVARQDDVRPEQHVRQGVPELRDVESALGTKVAASCRTTRSSTSRQSTRACRSCTARRARPPPTAWSTWPTTSSARTARSRPRLGRIGARGGSDGSCAEPSEVLPHGNTSSGGGASPHRAVASGQHVKPRPCKPTPARSQRLSRGMAPADRRGRALLALQPAADPRRRRRQRNDRSRTDKDRGPEGEDESMPRHRPIPATPRTTSTSGAAEEP